MALVTRLNQYRHECYNLADSTVSDAVYDRLYDELQKKDFLDYWLEYDVRRRVQSSNTYDTYSNIARNHIIPILGNKN